MEKNKSIVVCIAAGLPLAGKSTFINRFVGFLRAVPRFQHTRFLHLEVDNFESLAKARKLAEFGQLSLQNVHKYVELADTLPYAYDKESSEIAKEEVFGLVSGIISEPGTGAEGFDSLMVFVDDNHLKAGARRRYFKLCRNAQVGYAEFILKVDIDEAIARSKQRSHKIIDPGVIYQDFKEAELELGPYTIVIESATEVNGQLADRYISAFEQSRSDFRAFNEKRQAPKACEAKSTLSEIEEVLRKAVSEFIVRARQSNPKFAGELLLSSLKKEFFNDLKRLHRANPSSPCLSLPSVRTAFENLVNERLA